MVHPAYTNRQVHLPVIYGRVIAGLRTRAGLSQVQFAPMAFLSPSAQARVETGATSVSCSQGFAIENAFGQLGLLQQFGQLQQITYRTAQELQALGTWVRPYAPIPNVPLLESFKLDTAVSVAIDQVLNPPGQFGYPDQPGPYEQPPPFPAIQFYEE